MKYVSYAVVVTGLPYECGLGSTVYESSAFLGTEFGMCWIPGSHIGDYGELYSAI
jgi:hypothetical protein